MKWKLLTTLCIFILLIVAFSGCFEEIKNNPTTKSKTLYVDDGGGKEYKIIQEAVNNSSDGDLIFVYNGMYHENLIVNKQIILVGENKDNVIITSSNENTPIFNINNQNNVVIENLTVKGSTSSGIWVNNSSDVEIKNCKIYDCYFNGICLASCMNCKISSCDISQCGIEKEYIGYFGIGIGSVIFPSSKNSIDRCAIHNNSYGGIDIFWSNNTENIISNCTIINNNFYGIRCQAETSNNTIENCVILNNKHGISLKLHCDNCIITHCKISNSSEIGLEIYYSPESTVTYSTISNNSEGISIAGSSNTSIHHNNFINNVGTSSYWTFKNHIDSDGYSVIFFDNGEEGNYWDDYNGVDADGNGIGDSPYDITIPLYHEGIFGQDKYPLMNPVDI